MGRHRTRKDDHGQSGLSAVWARQTFAWGRSVVRLTGDPGTLQIMPHYVSPITCPWCNVESRFQFQSCVVRDHPEGFDDVNLYLCGACGMPVLGDDIDDGLPRMVFTWWKPAGYASPDYEGTPQNIADAAREAHRCMAVDAPNAVATMARRAAQGAARDLGAKCHTLFDQLKWLRSEGKITTSLFEVAETLRLAGNDGAHPLDKVSVQEAQQLLSFLDDLLLYVYGLPAKLKIATDTPADSTATA